MFTVLLLLFKYYKKFLGILKRNIISIGEHVHRSFGQELLFYHLVCVWNLFREFRGLHLANNNLGVSSVFTRSC